MQSNEKSALIPIRMNENFGNVISARELYDFLEVKTAFTHWCKRMFEYGFEENKDFAILVKNDTNISKSNPIDYALTLDTAKEIAMLQRSEKGKEARQYFIECEKALKGIPTPTELSRKELALMIIKSEEEKERIADELGRKARELELANSTIQSQAPKVEFADKVLSSKGTIRTTIIANELGMSAKALNQKLNELEVIYKVSGTWVLYAKYKDKGYATTETFPYLNSLKQQCTSIDLVWTEAGRQFIHNLLNPKLKLPVVSNLSSLNA